MIGYEDIQTNYPQKKITITFMTSRGYYHVHCKKGRIRELAQEPMLHSFPKREQYEIEWMAKIAYYFVFGPEDLNTSKT